MDYKNINIDYFNKRILSSVVDDQFGIANGKMGVCLYFYFLSEIEHNTNYKEIADNLLDEIISNLPISGSIRVDTGLSGIAIGIDILYSKKIIGGDINLILEEIDNVIYKAIVFGKISSYNLQPFDIMLLLYYLYVRYKRQDDEFHKFVFKELIIKITELLYNQLNSELFREPLSLSITYNLPLFLFIVGKLISLHIYSTRLEKIIDEFSHQILGSLPILHSHRLYLLWGLSNLNASISNIGMREHITFLSKNIDLNLILNKELYRNQIFLNNGVSLIYLLSCDLKSKCSLISTSFDTSLILDKLLNASIWDNDDSYSFGPLYGIPGALLILSLIKNK